MFGARAVITWPYHGSHVRAIRRFTVRVTLPQPLAPLHDLMLNLRWSWHPPTVELFASIDPAGWAASGGDPVAMLSTLRPGLLAELAANADFVRRLRGGRRGSAPLYLASRAGTRRPPLGRPARRAAPRRSPTSRPSTASPPCCRSTPAASASWPATTSRRPATSACRSSASACSTGTATSPSRCRPTGWQLEHYPPIDPDGLPLTLLRDGDGTPVADHDRPCPRRAQLAAQVWLAQVGRVPLLLLDSDVEENEPARATSPTGSTAAAPSTGCTRRCCWASAACGRCAPTARITGAPRARGVPHQRGPRRLPRPGADPGATSTAGLAFDEALEAVRAGTVFTTHTPVPAGIDRFPRELIERYFGGGNTARPAGRPGARARRRDLPRRRPGRASTWP